MKDYFSLYQEALDSFRQDTGDYPNLCLVSPEFRSSITEELRPTDLKSSPFLGTLTIAGCRVLSLPSMPHDQPPVFCITNQMPLIQD